MAVDPAGIIARELAAARGAAHPVAADHDFAHHLLTKVMAAGWHIVESVMHVDREWTP